MEQKEKSLAWFKLADLIARGEREKALNVFRLLSHSLPNRAYVLQVEGDILWHLDDNQASAEKYKQAAFLYQKEKRWIDAIAIYQHLIDMHPTSYELITAIMVLYALIDWPDRFQERVDLLIGLFNKRSIDEAAFIKTIKDVVDGIALFEDQAPKPWLKEVLSRSCAPLPPVVTDRLRGIW